MEECANRFDKAIAKVYGGHKQVIWREVLAGKKAYNETGNWLPNETLEIIKTHLLAIKGPLETPVGGGIRSLNVALRQELDLFACVRPVRYFKGVPSPLKHPEKRLLPFFEKILKIFTQVSNGMRVQQKFKRSSTFTR